ncbi:RimJ/RimL family protein N-acetyltransferase [Sphingomonas endophytica]|uniref:RimJ/RimL family protein N-acetyltransferase n=1 Tax=Sphingomonas endophytica TaxID=869719 RepID=A0A7X0J995_9SPHN|nr:GNAT family protein [Sphingomonas endophytica]MBB6503100.1 RimJ/RimL family protein N-acetyltransferase [Sphingomonas endophytica]
MSADAWRTVPTLVGRHVTLRPLDRTDRADLLSAFSGLTQVFATAVPGPATIDSWFDTLEAQRDAGRVLPFTLLDADGQVAGTTRLLRMSPGHHRAEIGGTLYARRVQRTALSTEMKRLLLGHSFDRLGCQCAQLRANWRNPTSRLVIERLGVRKDAVLRWHSVSGNGEVHDTVVYSIPAEDWPEIRRNLDYLLEHPL